MRQQDPDLDTSFGIYFGHDNIPRIGSKAITISGDDIIIEAQVYNGTPGLWSLITEKNPKDYNREDLEEYREIMEKTSALHRDYNTSE